MARATQEVPLLVCVVDALRGDAVHHFLAGMEMKQGRIVGEVRPPFSFEPDKAYLTGHHPEETDSGAHFWLNHDEIRPSRFGVSVWRVFDGFPEIGQKATRRLLSWFSRLRGRGLTMSARIPFSLLPYFTCSTTAMPTEQGYCSFPTIFDLLSSKHKKWHYLGAPVSASSETALSAQLSQLSFDNIGLLFLFVSDLDRIGHENGPDSSQYQQCAKKLGGFTERLYAMMLKHHKRCRLIVFGDHGMVRCEKKIDILNILSEQPYRVPDDYLVFVDSTMARFWFHSDGARACIMEKLTAITGGKWIDDFERNQYRINYKHNRFGEEIWWVEEGYLLFPNYWQGCKPVAGMHGYRWTVKDNNAAFILSDPKWPVDKMEEVDSAVDMVDLFATMLDFLGIEPPENSYGQSINKRKD